MLPLKRNDSGDMIYQDQLIATSHTTNGSGDHLLVIRPERLYLLKDSTVNSDQTIVFSGVVKEFVFQGETAFVVMSCYCYTGRLAILLIIRRW